MGKFYQIEKVPDEVMDKFNKVLTVLELEDKLAKDIQYNYPVFLEGFLHDGNTCGLYSYHNNFIEIESRLVTYTRLFVPELKYDQEEFAEDWQRLQLLVHEKDWIIKDLEELLDFLEDFDSTKLNEMLQELDAIAEKGKICYAMSGGVIV